MALAASQQGALIAALPEPTGLSRSVAERANRNMALMAAFS